MNLARDRRYRIVRVHKMERSKLGIESRSFNSTNNIKSFCLVTDDRDSDVDSLSQLDFSEHVVTAYDSDTFCQAHFQEVLCQPKPQQLWDAIKPHANLNNNSLLILLEQPESQTFFNFNLIDANSLQHPEVQKKRQQWGILERVSTIMNSAAQGDPQERVLLSIIGCYNNTLIDLLHLSREREDPLKVVREGYSTSIANSTQIEIKNTDFLMNSLLYAKHYRKMYEKSNLCHIQAELYQVAICRESIDGISIQSIKCKFNIVRLTPTAHHTRNVIQNCLRSLTKDELIPCRNSKLTHCLEDCFTNKTNITVLTQISHKMSLKQQIDILQFNNSLKKPFILKKNYCGDEVVVRKITKLSSIEQPTLYQSEERRNKSQKLPSIKINPCLLTETIASKRRISLRQHKRLPSPQLDSKQSPKNMYISGRDKRQMMRHLYKML